MIPFSFLDNLEDAIVYIFTTQPLLGPFLLLTIEEAGIPLPIPGDVYISYTGYQITKGTISYPVGFIALMLAVLIGSSILYWLSSYFGERIVLKFGKYIHLNKKKLNFIETKFRKYGALVIIVGRHIPGFRIPVTVFSGISKVDYKTFLLSEIISIVFWIGIFLAIGQKLGKRTLALFHNHYAIFFVLLIPVVLTMVTFLFGKFIPEEEPR